jgi:Helix-turn-helix of DDE superfamily endonuclease
VDGDGSGRNRAASPSFTVAWDEHRQTHHRAPTERKRALSAGRPSRLGTIEDKRCFILVSFKTYLLHEVMATLFGMSQSQANAWIHRLTIVLQTALQTDLHLPARDAATLETVLATCPHTTFAIDGTERPIQRSRDDTIQREQYSEKKRTRIKMWLMNQRIKLAITILLLPSLLLLAIFLTGSLNYISAENYLGLLAALPVSIYVCLYMNSTWNPEKLQPSQQYQHSALFNGRILWLMTILLFALLTVVSIRAGYDYPRAYGTFGMTIAIVLFGYVGLRIILK